MTRRIWKAVALVSLGMSSPAPGYAAQSAPRAGGSPASRPASAQPGIFTSTVRPLLAKYCLDCHGATKPKAGLNLTSLWDESKAAQNRRLWTKVKENVESGLMPP